MRLRTALAILATLAVLAVGDSRVLALQSPGPLAWLSVSGTLRNADTNLNRVIVQAADGRELGWELAPAVVAEAGRYKVGDPVTVVYRQIGVGEVALRALAFTGPNANPMYVNGTSNSVTLLTGPLVGGQCGKADPPPDRVARYPLAPGNMMEDKAACWCCAPQGASCRPSNPVKPRDHVVLAQCFE